MFVLQHLSFLWVLVKFPLWDHIWCHQTVSTASADVRNTASLNNITLSHNLSNQWTLGSERNPSFCIFCKSGIPLNVYGRWCNDHITDCIVNACVFWQVWTWCCERLRWRRHPSHLWRSRRMERTCPSKPPPLLGPPTSPSPLDTSLMRPLWMAVRAR